MDKKQVKQEKEQRIIELVSAFCQEKLDHEYKELCVKLVKKLGRKRNVPFMTGKLEIWAASVVHAIGQLNFLHDKSFEPYIPTSDIHDYFGTKNATVSAKSNMIQKILNVSPFDKEFSTSYLKKNNPFNYYVSVDDLIVPIQSLPVEYQEKVKAARARGEDISFSIKPHAKPHKRRTTGPSKLDDNTH